MGCTVLFFFAKVREAKAESEAAGAATRKDIEKLRGLHARRVKRLETLLREEGERLANARREIGEARQGQAKAPLCVPRVWLCVCWRPFSSSSFFQALNTTKKKKGKC